MSANAIACDLNAVQGTWQRSQPSAELADAGTEWVWAVGKDSVTVFTRLTDTYGVYFETETRYSLRADESTCGLVLTRGISIQRAYRGYDDATWTRPVEVKSNPATGESSAYQASITGDKLVLSRESGAITLERPAR